MKLLVAAVTTAMLLPIPQAYAGKGDFIGGVVTGVIANELLRQPAERPTQRRQSARPAPQAQSYSHLQSAFTSQPAAVRVQLQQRLKELQFYSKGVDGSWGNGTRQAIENYAIANSLTHLLVSKEDVNTLFGNILRPSPSNEMQAASATPVGASSATRSGTIPAPEANEGFQVLTEKFEELEQQIVLLNNLLENQKKQPEDEFRAAKIAAVEVTLASYNIEIDDIQTEADRQYQTPIRPTNQNTGMTALKASEIFPRIPYYIAGTEEHGEMWVAPQINDAGILNYAFNFMNPDATFATIREGVTLSSEEIVLVTEGLGKVNDWSKEAQEKNIRRNFSKAATCFPESDCAERKVGLTSTEVIFAIYEDGSTAAKIQRNKGQFSTAYNFSLESALLLAAYLEYMKEVGEEEFFSGTLTDTDLDQLFK